MDKRERTCIVYSAFSDKVLRMRESQGIEGYGIYLMLEGMLFESKNNLKIEKSLSTKLGITFEKLKSIICDFGLFHVHYRYFSSDNIVDFDENGKVLPPLSFYDNTNISMGQRYSQDVIDDLNDNELLKVLVKDSINTFIGFAATSRVEQNQANIEQEVIEFLELIEDGLV